MAGKSDYLEAVILNLLFKSTTSATLASAAGSLTNLYVALHTADPADAGTAVTNEATYTGYTRVTKNRSTDWTVSGTTPTQVVPAAAITFPAATAGTNTITHFSIVDTASGAGNILYSGTVTPNISVTNGVTPQLTTATTITED